MSWEHAAASYDHLKDSELCGAPQLSARVAKLSYGKARGAEQFRKVSGRPRHVVDFHCVSQEYWCLYVIRGKWNNHYQPSSTVYIRYIFKVYKDQFGTIWDRSIVPSFSPRPCWSHRWLRAMEAKLPELANWAKCLNQEDGSRFVCSLGGKFSWNLVAAGTADACLSLLFSQAKIRWFIFARKM